MYVTIQIYIDNFTLGIQIFLFYLQYAPEFVKRNLMKSLTTKIKLLKLLAAAARSQINKNTIIQSINKTLPGVINESILNFIGVSLNEYKSINPESELFKKDDKLIGNTNNKNEPVNENESKRRDLIDYLNEDNEILYKELLEDEISKVDKSFLKAAKHAGDNSGTREYHIFLWGNFNYDTNCLSFFQVLF